MTKSLSLLTLLAATSAAACSCVSFPSPKEAWLEAPLVFAGLIEKTDPKITGPASAAGQTAWARVTEPFKGVKADQVLVLHDRISSCFGGFPEAVPYLFYLFPGDKPGSWRMPACRRSRALSDAGDDLKFLRGLPASSRGNTVSGNVYVWEHVPGKGSQTRGLTDIPVHAIGASHSFDTITDAKGAYEFRDFPPGVYTILVDYPKGMTLRFVSAIGRITQGSLRRPYAEDSTELEVTTESANGYYFTLAPDTLISGRVLDPNGRPMKGVCLAIEPLQGPPQVHSPIPDCTKDDGSYSLSKMSPGTYRIVANPGGVITSAEPFGRLYQPGTSDPGKAASVTLAAGQHLTGIDFHVPQLAPRIELRGRLIFSDGVPAPNQTIDYRRDEGGRPQYTRTGLNGEFLIQVLAGHPGQLTGEMYFYDSSTFDCPQFASIPRSSRFGFALKSTPTPITGDSSRSALELVFPVPSCPAWLNYITKLQ